MEPTAGTSPEPVGEIQSSEIQSRIDEGRLYYRQREHERALSALEAAYEQCKNQGDLRHMAEIANDLGVIHTVSNQWTEAERRLNEAHNLFTNLQDYSGEAQALGNLGSMFRARGDLQQAAANLQLAADKFHLMGDDERRAMTLKVLSMVQLRQLRFLQALAAYDAALACNPKPSAWTRFLRRILALPLKIISG
ncbi:MAG: tetratricopeptide repeat protein [Anaerolineae bacterium]|nr:tetratricopeptide repeat protein [Anaerolineae bacterium]